jgi:hypothetical protein
MLTIVHTDFEQENVYAIPVTSPRADLIRETSAIVWDELPAAHVTTFECVD